MLFLRATSLKSERLTDEATSVDREMEWLPQESTLLVAAFEYQLESESLGL